MAIKALDKCMEVVPPETVPFNYFALSLIEGYYQAGAIDKATAYSQIFVQQSAEEVGYMLSLPDRLVSSVRNETDLTLYILQELYRMAQSYGNDEHKSELEELFDAFG